MKFCDVLRRELDKVIHRPTVIRRGHKLSLYGDKYGSFIVCTDLLHKDKIIVYSFGIGEDLSFSESILKRHNAEIWAYDPTPKSANYVRISSLYNNPKFHFSTIGLSDKDEVAPFHLPKNESYISGSVVRYEGVKEETIDVEMKCLNSIARENKHSFIDILKMDIEGSEFKVIEKLHEAHVDIGQICVEVHNRFFDEGDILLSKLISDLEKDGFDLVAISYSEEEYLFCKRMKI